MRRAALHGEGWYPYLFTNRRIRWSNDMVRQFAAEAGRELDGFHWGLNQPTAISTNGDEAMELAVRNVGERYVTPDRSAEDIARALCVAGTPDDCAREMEAKIEAGVEHVNLGFLASRPRRPVSPDGPVRRRGDAQVPLTTEDTESTEFYL